MDFAIPAVNWVKLKESEKKDNYLNIAKELKNKTLSNMKVKVKPVVIGSLGTVTKWLVQWLEDL